MYRIELYVDGVFVESFRSEWSMDTLTRDYQRFGYALAIASEARSVLFRTRAGRIEALEIVKVG